MPRNVRTRRRRDESQTDGGVAALADGDLDDAELVGEVETPPGSTVNVFTAGASPSGSTKTGEPSNGDDAPETFTAAQVAEREKAAADAEFNRQSEIRELAADDIPKETVDKAIKEKWSVDKARGEFLNILRSGRPKLGLPISVSNGNQLAFTASLVSGILQTCGIPVRDDSERHAGESFRGMGFAAIARACIMRECPEKYTEDKQKLFAAASSTVSFPVALGEVMNRSLQAGFDEAPKTLFRICGEKSAPDFRTSTAITLSPFANPGELAKGGDFKHSYFEESSETHKAKTLGHKYTISRKDFINDDLGIFSAVRNELGLGIVDATEDLILAILTMNAGVGPVLQGDGGKNLFATNHTSPNYVVGADSVLSLPALEAAWTLFRKAKHGTRKINLAPKLSLVPAALEFTMEKLLSSPEIREGRGGTAAKDQTTKNVMMGRIAPENRLVSSKLDDYSALAWYLIADPARRPALVLTYLNGVKTPYFLQDTPAEPLAYTFIVYHDVGVDAIDYVTIQKNKGEA